MSERPEQHVDSTKPPTSEEMRGFVGESEAQAPEDLQDARVGLEVEGHGELLLERN